MEKLEDIIYSIAYEKNLDKDKVKGTLKEALLDMAKQTIDSAFEYSVYIDEQGKKGISLCKKIFAVDGDGSIEEGTISAKEAKEVDDSIVVGDFLELEIDLQTLTRSSTNFLFIALEKRLQVLLEEQMYQKYKKQLGQIIRATVVRIDNYENTIVEIGEVRGVMPLKNRIKGEKFQIGDTFSSILNHIKITNQGIHLELSRTTPKFLNELLRLEVPELKDGQLEIMNSSRIPGVRAKVAIKSYSPTIDPIGSIVGTKGIRIKSVSAILSGENIDCIEYSDKIEIFITRALSPAIVTHVSINEEEKKAIATVAYEQKRKAIGANGFNIRLASMLTDYHIDVIEEEGSESMQGDGYISNSNKSSLEDLFNNE